MNRMQYALNQPLVHLYYGHFRLLFFTMDVSQ